MALERYAEAHPQFGGSSEITLLLARALRESVISRPIVDIGCGEGGTINAIRKTRLGKVVGCDLSERRARIATNRGFAVFLADVLRLPMADDSVALAVCRHVIEHVEDDLDLLRELGRIVTPGGLVYVETPLRLRGAWYPYRNARGEWMLDPTHVREYRSVQDLLDSFAKADLLVESWNTRRIRFPLVHALYRLFPRLAAKAPEDDRKTVVKVSIPRYRELQVLGRKIRA